MLFSVVLQFLLTGLRMHQSTFLFCNLLLRPREEYKMKDEFWIEHLISKL